ncbi:MAG TPA: hypothetical protein VNH38_04130 [Candidatus Dormibacteraeota bacterium]|nr:hypothetical protein [Candidatus Dormibacteraeota bacterium]
MRSAWRLTASALLALGLTLTGAAVPVLAAGGWWVSAPSASRPISAVASSQGMLTLAISNGVPGWYLPSSGRFTPADTPGHASASGPAVAVATAPGLGVVAYRGGELAELRPGRRPVPLSSVAGVPRALALAADGPTLLAVATSRGLFSGQLGSRLNQVAAGDGQAVIAPSRPGWAWAALIGGRIWTRSSGGGWARAPDAPPLDPQTRAIAELGSGAILVGEPGGLVWRGSRGRWDQSFQVLPYGGLGGVPKLTSLVADGANSAYLGTEGFGTLLTPDGGYTWYRAAPADGLISALATVGPVFATHAHGLVVALSPHGVFLHHLQALPQPPTYTVSGATAELAGTAGVTLAAALLVTLLLWYLTRRQRRLSV